MEAGVGFEPTTSNLTATFDRANILGSGWSDSLMLNAAISFQHYLF